MKLEMTLQAIGVVGSPVTEIAFTGWAGVVSEITLEDALVPGLRGLSDYSHIVVVFYLDRAHFDPAKDLVRHPRDRMDWPLTGVFATRTQFRPCPLGITTAQLLGIAGNVLTVKGLDALDGTPVLDIKPYVPDPGLASTATAPQWLGQNK